MDADLQTRSGVLGHCVNSNKLLDVYFFGCTLKMQVGLGVRGSMPTICPMAVWETLCTYWVSPKFITIQEHLNNAQAKEQNVSKIGRGGPMQKEVHIVSGCS